jgi:hypothetical protein
MWHDIEADALPEFFKMDREALERGEIAHSPRRNGVIYRRILVPEVDSGLAPLADGVQRSTKK